MDIERIHHRIGVSRRTPIIALFSVDVGWIVWTAVKDPKAKYSEWQGTYLLLYHNGACDRITIHSDYSEDIITVKGPN